MALDINARFAAIERELENQKDFNRKLQEQVSSAMNIKKVANECTLVLTKVSDILKDRFDDHDCDREDDDERKELTIRMVHIQVMQLAAQVKELDKLIKKSYKNSIDYFKHICDDDIDYVKHSIALGGDVETLKGKKSA
jgi:hypothetical protein